MLRNSFVLAFFILISVSVSAAPKADDNIDPVKKHKFLEAKALNGDGVYAMLRRYKLIDYSCNKAQFYLLNNLNANDQLKVDQSYKLPMIVYEYNGISIRSTIGIDDYDQAVRIKNFNESARKNRLRNDNYIESKVLWVPYHELYCNADTDLSKPMANLGKEPKPKVGKTIKEDGLFVMEPLFGSKESKVKIIDNSLKNKVYYLVSGHGGPDSGAQCLDCEKVMCEDEYAYDVVLRLAKNLMEHGAKVHIVIQDKNDGIRTEKYLKCDRDEYAMGGNPLPLNQIRRLEQRSKKINKLYNDYKAQGIKEQYAIMVHVDSRSKEKRQDVFFYYYEHGRSSKKLALTMQDKFKEKYDLYQKNRGYKGFVQSRNLYMVRNTMPTALFIELANIRNHADQERILRPENRQHLANWIAEGLMEFKS